MFRITLDLFNGRANPSWIVSGPEADAALRTIALDRAMIGSATPPWCTPYRGTHIELLGDHLSTVFNLPVEFTIATPGAANISAGIALTERLMAAHAEGMAASFDGLARTYINDQLAAVRPMRERELLGADAGSPGPAVAALDPPPKGCIVESTQFNPSFWGGDRQRANNCYAYAANQPTGHWPQIPGKASGHPMTAYTAASASAGAKSDGAHDVDVCFAQSESPRWLVALVIAPGIDFHWYRHSAEGFWGHKPGQFPVVNIDCSSKIITDPRHCDRGKYTEFYGYMILPRSQRVN